MLQGWFVIVVALCYLGLLFVVASYGDRRRRGRDSRWRVLIYPFSLAIYCTSWTFFGSVGLAATTGIEFLTIYIGPILMIGFASPLVLRIVRLAKAQNTTSIADFIAARYGKRQAVAVIVALIAIVGSIPYIALQLKAVASSINVILANAPIATSSVEFLPLGDMALFVAITMAVFTMLFGTRHVDATEHQDGMMLAIAGESMIKLVAFIAVGTFVTFVMFDGPSALLSAAMHRADTQTVLSGGFRPAIFATMTLLSFFAIMLLPRQFHVTVVENHNEAEVRRAAWMFPVYLILINLFVIPIAIAGMLKFNGGTVNSDMFVLALPLAGGSQLFTLAAFVGGLSAATAMVIVETVALSIMMSNDIIVPFILKRSEKFAASGKIGETLLTVRRISIIAILALAYFYYRFTGEAQLASIGLLSFAAVSQLAPAFFGGLFWRRATARGAIAGMSIGTIVWAYTLLLPSFADADPLASIVANGPWGLEMLRPQALFGLDLPPLTHGVVCSLLVNMAAYVLFSLQRAPTAIERLQSDLFVPADLTPIAPSLRRWRSSVTVEELTATVARYLGDKRTRTSFDSFAAARRVNLDPKSEADIELMRYAEHLLASGIGAASSRLVLSLLLRKRTVSTQAALKLLDDANAAIHYNREVLQTALDQVRQGIAVFDNELHLICWNRQFGEILDLPPSVVRVGATLAEMLRFNAEQGAFGKGDPEALVSERLTQYAKGSEPFFERFPDRNLVVEVRSDKMPGGGIVTTLTDITPSVEAAEALERANASLEGRVRTRTKELERLNTELLSAKAIADDANISKTRFLAAASHDLLQPLNAARLYVTSLVERQGNSEDAPLIGNIDASLDAVEEILGALLDISRLDSGVLKPEIASFRIDEILRALEVEFAPLAQEKGLKLKFVASSLTVTSDRRLLRRLLQNLVSNAVKYTPKGRVLVGCRRSGDRVRIDVIDTGIGIPKSKQRVIFQEFHRLEQGAKVARGLGLGMSIVERIARVLDHPIEIESALGRGSQLSVEAPRAAPIAAVAQRRTSHRVALGPLTGMRVLCIDNEPKILDGMATLLGGWGCNVLKAAGLPEALVQIAPETMPLGMMVDYHLDGHNGLDAIATLRKRHGDLPAILITADRGVKLRNEAEAANVQVLYKPLKPAALRASLGQWRVQRIAAAE